ncbi:hypothetical protein [Stenotrophomonas maltophilia]|uniref:hypothetical protein n=1 Tax=Stenotrophomonas maltophilia TaxID=40324 RepID=UPI0013DBF0AC|nr:hypothetical protein [Stenotrophomonas maltophilia]
MNDDQGWRSKLDRETQRQILETLAEDYPEDVVVESLYGVVAQWKINANVSYLEDHGLLTAEYSGPKHMGHSVDRATITHKGIDFLQNDGGLGAILDVVTIKIHEDSIKDLISQKIRASDLPAADKEQYLDQLRELPGEATKHLALKMVDAGLENWRRALPLLKSILNWTGVDGT